MGPKVFFGVEFGRKMGFLWWYIVLASFLIIKMKKKREKDPFRNEDKLENE